LEGIVSFLCRFDGALYDYIATPTSNTPNGGQSITTSSSFAINSQRFDPILMTLARAVLKQHLREVHHVSKKRGGLVV